MAIRKKTLPRADARIAAKQKVPQNIRPWPMALETNLPRITRLAADEWNFEKFYDAVRRFAGGTLTREMLQDFIKSKGITIKSRPKAGGKML